MGGVIGIGKIEIVLEELIGGEHALVDEDLRRERTNVEQLGLLQRRVGAKLVRHPLTDHIELSLEGFALNAISGGNEQLLDYWLGVLGGGADVGAVAVGADATPADEPLALL